MKGFVLTNNKGQALVEFILIFPIIVLILCIIIDFSNVFVSENKLENKLDDVIYLIRNNYRICKKYHKYIAFFSQR